MHAFPLDSPAVGEYAATLSYSPLVLEQRMRLGAIAMFTVTDNTTLANGNTNGSPYADELADLQLPFVGIATEYVDLTPDNLSITTDSPSFITSGTGNDVIVDASAAPGDVVIDAGSGANTIQCSSSDQP